MRGRVCCLPANGLDAHAAHNDLSHHPTDATKSQLNPPKESSSIPLTPVSTPRIDRTKASERPSDADNGNAQVQAEQGTSSRTFPGLVLDVRSNDGPGSHVLIAHRECLAERIRLLGRSDEVGLHCDPGAELFDEGLVVEVGQVVGGSVDQVLGPT